MERSRKKPVPYYRQFRAKTSQSAGQAIAQVIWLIFGLSIAVYSFYVNTKRHFDIYDTFSKVHAKSGLIPENDSMFNECCNFLTNH